MPLSGAEKPPLSSRLEVTIGVVAAVHPPRSQAGEVQPLL